jgi:rubrerythrin
MRFRKCLAELRPGAVFRKGREVYWYWTNCGHIEKGLEAPKACPVCAHPQSYFRAMLEGEVGGPIQFTSSAEGP